MDKRAIGILMAGYLLTGCLGSGDRGMRSKKALRPPTASYTKSTKLSDLILGAWHSGCYEPVEVNAKDKSEKSTGVYYADTAVFEEDGRYFYSGRAYVDSNCTIEKQNEDVRRSEPGALGRGTFKVNDETESITFNAEDPYPNVAVSIEMIYVQKAKISNSELQLDLVSQAAVMIDNGKRGEEKAVDLTKSHPDELNAVLYRSQEAAKKIKVKSRFVVPHSNDDESAEPEPQS